MVIWARRLLYFVLIVIWLLVMAFPVVAVVLATQGEIRVTLDREPLPRQLRLFLIQERQQEGLGLEWTTPATDSCYEGHISYFMWQGQGENSVFCTCVGEAGSVVFSAPGTCAQR